MSLVNKRNNFYIDHIAIGADELSTGIEYIEKLTGVKAFIPESQEDQWYKSGAIGLGKGCFLEIIAPNPIHKKFHPFKQVLKELTQPQLMFWYIGTDEFKECKAAMSNIGFKIKNYTHVQKEIDNQLLDFEIGIIGKKRFESEIPCLIQWNEIPSKRREKIEHICKLNNFQLISENHDTINSLFDTLEIQMNATKGKSEMILTIETPKGEITIRGGGIKFPFGFKSIPKVLRLYKNHKINK